MCGHGKMYISNNIVAQAVVRGPTLEKFSRPPPWGEFDGCAHASMV